MRTLTMFFFAALLLIPSAEALTLEVPTYRFQDPETGQILVCNKCPAGYHMDAHCTATHQTKCAPCPANHFTQYWNYLSKCLYCNKFCGENEFMKEECSPIHNRVCECKTGYYQYLDVCLKHADCQSGHGVLKEGSSYTNTVCEKCKRGSYSSVSSPQASCKNHTDCASLGLRLVLRGTVWRDNLCASCEELKTKGGLSLLRDILPDYFAHWNMKQSKVRSFVKRSLNMGNNTHVDGTERLHDKKQQLACIKNWIQNADAEALNRLPEMFRKSKLYKVANGLENIRRSLNNANVCDSVE